MGLSNKAIASQLNISPRTVEGHLEPCVREGGGVVPVGPGPAGHGERARPRLMFDAPGTVAPTGCRRPQSGRRTGPAGRPALDHGGPGGRPGPDLAAGLRRLQRPGLVQHRELPAAGHLPGAVLDAATTFGLGGGLVVAAASALATVPWAVQALRQQRPGRCLVRRGTGGRCCWSSPTSWARPCGPSARPVRPPSGRARTTCWPRSRYRDLFEANSQPIFLVDLSGVVHEANVAAEDLLGHGPGSLVA